MRTNRTRGVSDGSCSCNISYTSALTNKLDSHALNVCRLCTFVVVNQMV